MTIADKKNVSVSAPDAEAEPNDAVETPSPDGAPLKLHPAQRLMDNPWILLVLGILIPFLSYTTWGWVELLLIKPAQLP